MSDNPSFGVRLIGVAEVFLSAPLLVLGVWMLFANPLNGLIILANASASYLLGRYTYRKGTTVGSALLHLGHLLVLMLISFVLCRVIADVVRH